ncbi:phosphoribosylformylglycinamidine synthase subunit PurQ [bacterium]|nr:phosphoribosylformylglycinamidine synthase subunit PurQ [bacterium]
MKFGVIVFPGSNDDRDTEYAIGSVLGQSVKRIWHKETSLKDVDCVVLPGGFSYGDYLRCGAMAKMSPIMQEVVKFANNGGYVFGICNGFQVLTETGLLPGALLQNQCLSFVCEMSELEVKTNNSPFTKNFKKNEMIHIPIKHNDGCYFAQDDVLKELEDNDQIIIKYKNNPNGSIRDIAGICNKKKNVIGMMPHPEHAFEMMSGSTDGKRFFESLLI